MHTQFEVWYEPSVNCSTLPWAAQMVNYVARFETKTAAEKFVEAVKIFRHKHGLK